jgi:hypothetical protein
MTDCTGEQCELGTNGLFKLKSKKKVKENIDDKDN